MILAASISPLQNAEKALSKAYNELEQAVSNANDGPSKPKLYEMRFAAIARLQPVKPKPSLEAPHENAANVAHRHLSYRSLRKFTKKNLITFVDVTYQMYHKIPACLFLENSFHFGVKQTVQEKRTRRAKFIDPSLNIQDLHCTLRSEKAMK
ncbi:hypothetical protein GQX74_000784 [Glossina fuscipes]|nr:hypothetical protein GQX74_000784 [Glossina fuscipes]